MCKIYQYLRFSTGKQDEKEQANICQRWFDSNGQKCDGVIKDEAVSGGVSYKDRNLITLFERLESGDTIVVSELSRLTRGGIIELSEMIEKFFKPRKVRLIIVNVGLDIDCAHTSPMVELQLAMLATFAKIEKQSIVERTKSALEVRKKMLAENGSFTSKAGNVCTHIGNRKGVDMSKARIASAASKQKAAREKESNKVAYGFMSAYAQAHGLRTEAAYKEVVDTLNRMGIKTSMGCEYNVKRARDTWARLKKLYA